MNATVGERLASLKQRSGMTMSEIARLSGYAGPSSIQRYFAPEYDPSVLDYRFALKLVDAMQGAGDPPIDAYEIMSLTDRGAMQSPGAPFARKASLSNKEWISAYETSPVKREYADGRGGGFTAEAIVIHRGNEPWMFEVPPFLEKRDVYGFMQSGQSMYPRVRDGEFAFTEGRRRPALGDYVMVIVEERQEEDEAVAILGELSVRTSDGIELRQPTGALIKIPIEDVSAMRRIMNPEDLINSRERY